MLNKQNKLKNSILSMIIAPGEVISCSQAFPSLCAIGSRGARQVNRASLNESVQIFSLATKAEQYKWPLEET